MSVETGAAYKLISLPNIFDPRGNVIVGEFERSVPFAVKRFFMIYQVPLTQIRGEHAHKRCQQLILAARGGISVIADDGACRKEFRLDRPDFGVYLPPMVWATQYNYTPDALLLVFASEFYDKDDYIRDYTEFKALIKLHPVRV